MDKEPRKKHITHIKYGISTKDEGFNIRYGVARRMKALEAYSNGKPECVCCGFDVPDYLELDHIGGGGTKERIIAKNNMVWWVIRNNFPEGFQILCSLCNRSKRNRPECLYHKYIPKYKDRNLLSSEATEV